MSPKTTTAHTLRLARVIKASPDSVFRAWTEPDQLKHWSAPDGYAVVSADVDLRVGGRYRLRMESPEGTTHTAYGTYREIRRPERLVYTWSWEEQDDHEIGETVVTVEFRDRKGSTEVVLVHEGFPTDEDRGNHEQGWTSCLERLETLHS